MKKLYSTEYGSKLYGTSTPTSDTDLKHIVLMDLSDLLMGKKLQNIVHKTNNVKSTQNTVEDIDEEFIPLQVLALDFLAGQTYAIELVFSIDGNHANQTFYDRNCHEMHHSIIKQTSFYDFVKELKEQFLTSNIKAMMGYVVNQANIYSFKGERYNCATEVQALFEQFSRDLTFNEIINSDFRALVDQLKLKYPKYFTEEDYDIGKGVMRQSFRLLEKTIPFTMTVEHAQKVVTVVLSKYGSKAKSASENNVDTKAMMHAVRIVDKGLTLLETGTLSFPVSENYREYLLNIKAGNVDTETLRLDLSEKLDKLKELVKTTTLQEYNEALNEKFNVWLRKWLNEFYADQFVEALHYR